MNNIINIRHLRVFLAVVRCKSISKATEVVFLSQPAITQALAKLETSFEATLFIRKSDGMYVSESGKLLMFRVDRALQIVMDGLRDAIRLGCGDGGSRTSQLFNMLTTTQLRALTAVADAGSFSVAGRNLRISQSSLHRSCRELEELLGVGLFEKTSVGISATKAGLSLGKSAKLAFAEIEQAREEIYSLNQREIGHIVIGSMPLARALVLPATIIEFSKSFPDFKISVDDGVYSDLLYHLRHADVDFLVGALRLPAPSDDVVEQELFSSRLVVVARSGHALSQEEAIGVEQLAKAPWVVPRKGTPTRSIFDSLFSSAKLASPKSIVESGSKLLTVALLEHSDRLTMISEHHVQQDLVEGGLTVLPFAIPHASRPIGMTFRKGWRPTKTQQVFIDMLIRKSEQINASDFWGF